jgi:hypothetical protein
MAMLALTEVFARTWGAPAGKPPAAEFWSDARVALPGFVLLAEVYWDLEAHLQHLGFDYTYDKSFYDRLVRGTAREMVAHLAADSEYQRRSARFIENHDEERSAARFGRRVRSAAVAAATLQGMRFFHDGQFEGRRARLPVQLGRAADEAVDEPLLAFYRRLLAIVDDDVFHVGDWRLLDVAPAWDDTSQNIAAWRWKERDELRIVVVNMADSSSQAHVRLNDELPKSGDAFTFEDVLNRADYRRPRAMLESAGGLFVRLDAGESHIFDVRSAP